MFISIIKIIINYKIIINLINLLLNMNRTHMKERFLTDLRKFRETLTGEELAKALQSMRKRLENDLNLLSADIVVNMLISFREIQDYNSMVQMINDLESLPNSSFTYTPAIRHLYAFALNRRREPGDRNKALAVIRSALDKEENHFPDMLCLAGRIYKDIFVESQYQDTESLDNAINWYRKGFEVQPNEYAGINLATLLVIKGNEFAKCPELQHIASVLNILIGRKGSLKSIQDYWDVATFFEICVLAENYSKAIQAAECMFNLKPPGWYLKSTIGNIQLINQFHRKSEDAILTPEEQVFHFWMEYFIDATNDSTDNVIRFPIVVLETDRTLMPSHVNVNLDAQDGKELQISNICMLCLKNKAECKRPHSWIFTHSNIRGVRYLLNLF
jgi:mitogen-activated protein kinase kinase kinase 5